ncbi:MAG TPA: YkgJ family cysteine cluster protein [Gemmatimonadales bacterium]|nr:YkgJ family cysteine cluster protein [Gemmatimonadales bacterium]
MPESVGSPYPELLTALDRWADRAHHDHPGVIPCRSGCTACCHGPFDISVADTLMLRDAVRRLPPTVRAGVLVRAEILATRIRGLAPDWKAPWDIGAIGDERFDTISEALVDQPCPLLDADGGCLIYADRPLICRWMGLGLIAEDGRTFENGCPIQDQFPEFAALPPVPFALEPFETREAICLEDAAEALLGSAERQNFETTIALALDHLDEKFLP